MTNPHIGEDFLLQSVVTVRKVLRSVVTVLRVIVLTQSILPPDHMCGLTASPNPLARFLLSAPTNTVSTVLTNTTLTTKLYKDDFVVLSVLHTV